MRSAQPCALLAHGGRPAQGRCAVRACRGWPTVCRPGAALHPALYPPPIRPLSPICPGRARARHSRRRTALPGTKRWRSWAFLANPEVKQAFILGVHSCTGQSSWSCVMSMRSQGGPGWTNAYPLCRQAYPEGYVPVVRITSLSRRAPAKCACTRQG